MARRCDRPVSRRGLECSTDGAIWAIVADRVFRGNDVCPVRPNNDIGCVGVTDGFFVIRPEAVAATEQPRRHTMA
jgi:hypothetical protein